MIVRWVFGRSNIQDLVHSLLKLSTRGKMLPNNTDIQGKEKHVEESRKDEKTGNVIKSIFAYYFISVRIHQLHCFFNAPNPACLTSPPLLPNAQASIILKSVLKIYHILLDYNPSPLSSCANHMKSGQCLPCLVSLQLSTSSALAIGSQSSFYVN